LIQSRATRQFWRLFSSLPVEVQQEARRAFGASLTLAQIPPETFEYRLGSRSALEWIVDQYQVKGESDPNREDDPGYIVRLVGQVIRVSVETVKIVKTLPAFFP
jgi:predicted helicase